MSFTNKEEEGGGGEGKKEEEEETRRNKNVQTGKPNVVGLWCQQLGQALYGWLSTGGTGSQGGFSISSRANVCTNPRRKRWEQCCSKCSRRNECCKNRLTHQFPWRTRKLTELSLMDEVALASKVRSKRFQKRRWSEAKQNSFDSLHSSSRQKLTLISMITNFPNSTWSGSD